MASLLIKNANIVCEENDDLTTADVLVENGIISKIGQGVDAPEGAHVIDVRYTHPHA